MTSSCKQKFSWVQYRKKQIFRIGRLSYYSLQSSKVSITTVVNNLVSSVIYYIVVHMLVVVNLIKGSVAVATNYYALFYEFQY